MRGCNGMGASLLNSPFAATLSLRSSLISRSPDSPQCLRHEGDAQQLRVHGLDHVRVDGGVHEAGQRGGEEAEERAGVLGGRRQHVVESRLVVTPAMRVGVAVGVRVGLWGWQ